jgi:hypothetical protein
MWQLRESDTATAGFTFAITDAEDVLAWCAREDDATFIVDAREVAPEIVKAVEQLVTHERAPALLIKSLLKRVGGRRTGDWKHRLVTSPPPGFPCAITEAGKVVAYAKTIAVADFIVEISTNVPALVAATRPDANNWETREWADVTVLVHRLHRRLANLGQETPGLA